MYQQSAATHWGEGLLAGGVVVQYLSTRFALHTTGEVNEWRPGARALAQWLPIGSTALAALALRQPGMAVAMVFGSSVACLSLLLGASMYVAPLRELPPEKRLWALALPPTLLVLLAGFRGSFTWLPALMLLAMGAAFLAIWVERPTLANPVAVPGAQSTSALHQRARWKWIVPALVLAAAGAWASARGALTVGESSRLVTSNLIAATVLSALLLLPVLGAGNLLGQRGQTAQAVTALSGMVLLNLCLLLPLIILLDYAFGGLSQLTTSQWLGTFAGLSTPYPLATWRVDSVILLLLASALAVIAFGRWLPERVESTVLVFIYVAYVMAETVVAMRII